MQQSPIRGYDGGGMRGEMRPKARLAGQWLSPVAPVPVAHRSVKLREVPKVQGSDRVYEAKGAKLGRLGYPLPNLWVWLSGALITAAFFSALVFRNRDEAPHLHEHIVPEIRADHPPQKTNRAIHGAIEGWDRLNEALAHVPVESVGPILDEANTWLSARGEPGCSVRSAGGRISVVLGLGELSAHPLESAFSGCADAAQHRLKSPPAEDATA